jgi:hypothetical protein
MKEVLEEGSWGPDLKLTPSEKNIRLTTFHRILAGNRSNADELLLTTGLSLEQLEPVLKNLVHKGLLVLDQQGAVVGSHGLSLVPTEHRLTINKQPLFAWCAVDAIGIPAALAADAKINSLCFQCHEPIEITMLNGAIQSSSAPDIRIWMIEADIDRSIVGLA